MFISENKYLQVMQDREVARLFHATIEDWNTMDQIDKYRYRTVVLWWFIFHENIYHQWRKKLIDEETYQTWAGDFENYLTRHVPKQLWEDLLRSTLFQPSFIDHLHQLMQKHEAMK